LSQIICQTENICFLLPGVPLICSVKKKLKTLTNYNSVTLQSKGTLNTPTFYHRDKISLVAVIKCRFDKKSIINCRMIVCRCPFSQNLTLIPKSILSVVPLQN